MITRREFVALLGCMAITWPLAGRALQQATPVIGFLNSASPEPFARNVAAFRQALTEAGYIDGQNIAIEYCWAAQSLRLQAPRVYPEAQFRFVI